MRRQTLCVVVTLLLSAGVIATLLAVLMIPELDSSTSDGGNEEPAEPGGEIMEGEFVYAEIPSVGKIRGKKSEYGAAVFNGIQFGAPPVGELRWAKPRPAEPPVYDGGYYDATFSRPGCPQNCTLPSPDYVCPAEDDMDEDCLYLNINLPSSLTKEVVTSEGHYYTLVDSIRAEALPVMVFFHGGAFIAGSNGVPLYDGQFIAEKGNVIVVVVNYRLGPFGFFYQDNGNSEAALGNYGIWDQIEALRWVRDRIAYLGGDNEKVTIFGESAGAQSIAVHMVNEHSKPLFDRAILESNPFGLNFKTAQEAQETGDYFVTHIKRQSLNYKCEENDLACLRKIPMRELLQHYSTFPIIYQLNPNSITQVFEPWAPIMDNDLLSQHPFYEFSQLRFHNKPMMFGFTTHEAAFFVAQALDEPNTSNQLYTLLTNALFGVNGTDVYEFYPPECGPFQTTGCDNRITMDKVVADYMFTCPSRKVFQNEATFGDPDLNVWWYTFDQLWSFPDFWEQYKICYNLTCHAAELPYLFDMDKITEFKFTTPEQELAEKLIVYWTNFAKHGSPNAPQEAFAETTEKTLPPVKYWPRIFEGSTPDNVAYKTMKLTDSDKGGEEVVDDFLKKECDFWDAIDLYLKDDLKLSDVQLQEFKKQFNIKELTNGIDRRRKL